MANKTGDIVRIGREGMEALRLSEHLFVEIGEFRHKPQAVLSLYFPEFIDSAFEYDLTMWTRKAKLSLWKGDIEELLTHRKEIEEFLMERT